MHGPDDRRRSVGFRSAPRGKRSSERAQSFTTLLAKLAALAEFTYVAIDEQGAKRVYEKPA